MKSISEKLRKHKKMVIAIGLILVLLIAFKVIATDKPAEGMQDNTVTVEVAQAELTDSLSGLSYKADLVPAEEATVSCNLSGQVTAVLFENGDTVTQGQVLVRIDDKDLQNQLATARIDLAQLQRQLSSSQNDYETAKELYESGAYSKNAYENAALAYQTVLANVDLKKVAIADIQNALKDCAVKAPINGEIGGGSVNVGQYVNTGTAFATIKNDASVKAEIRVQEQDLAKIAVGQTVLFKWSEEETDGVSGVVETIAASADSTTRLFDCLIRLDNTNGTLHTGISGVIEIADPENREILAVPIEAITGSEGNYSVFIIADGAAQKKDVSIGAMSDDMAEITKGLQKGDQIIVSNLNSLQDGDKVRTSGEGK